MVGVDDKIAVFDERTTFDIAVAIGRVEVGVRLEECKIETSGKGKMLETVRVENTVSTDVQATVSNIVHEPQVTVKVVHSVAFVRLKSIGGPSKLEPRVKSHHASKQVQRTAARGSQYFKASQTNRQEWERKG